MVHKIASVCFDAGENMEAIYMNGQMETQLGKVYIDPEVIATYAGSVAVECFGIVGMAAVNVKDGLVKLLKKDYLTHGINVSINAENKITIDGIKVNCS